MLPPSSHAAVAKRAVHCRMRGRVVVRNEAREVRSGFGYVNVSHSRVPTSVVAEESDNESERHRGERAVGGGVHERSVLSGSRHLASVVQPTES